MKPPLADTDKGVRRLFMEVIHALKSGAPGKQLLVHVDLSPGTEKLHEISRPVLPLKAFSCQENGRKRLLGKQPLRTGTEDLIRQLSAGRGIQYIEIKAFLQRLILGHHSHLLHPALNL